MAIATNLGFPRIGPRRELKRAVEAHWAGDLDASGLEEQAAAVRRENWQTQQRAGLDHIPSGDFSLYDHVLDTAVMVGAVPRRFGFDGAKVDLRTYFAMARGLPARPDGTGGQVAMEMTKWFDTNYHYIVPEFEPEQTFRLASTKPVDEFLEARALGLQARPVLLGPLSFLLLGKPADEAPGTGLLLDGLLPVYETVVRQLAEAGAEWIQMDEPMLGLDLPSGIRDLYRSAYARLSDAAPGVSLLLTSYFEGLRGNLALALELPVAGVHLDLVRGAGDLEPALERAPAGLTLSLGVVDGRNVWRTDLERTLATVERAVSVVGTDGVLIAPSCSLLHSPVDLDLETTLDSELRSWMAFARQKVEEVTILARAVRDGRDAVADALAENARAMKSRRTSRRTRDPEVRERLKSVDGEMLRRSHGYGERRELQRASLDLPLFPTTTIGSFPQTGEIRNWRAAHRRGDLEEEEYTEFIRATVERTIRFQEEAGLDVLVHGEPERSDMVEYFAERLPGFAVSDHGWVQSYGSRCVKPPIIFGDVRHRSAMTVGLSVYAQSLTGRPVKGMLTGPVTMLQWSFVRDDQPRRDTAHQIALAVRDEVAELERAGIGVIQIDEPALREGLPLDPDDQPVYLRWAVDAFRLASAGVQPRTQIHTHMCYAEFNDIIEWIAELDADVISLEASRSGMELLDAFADFEYPNEVGPGVYDIHSPRVPSVEEMEELLSQAARVLPVDRLWVNPDCGLKTRRWVEVQPALTNMVRAAERVRGRFTS